MADYFSLTIEVYVTKKCLLTFKPFLGSLKTPEDKKASYFCNQLDIYAANFDVFATLTKKSRVGSLTVRSLVGAHNLE